MIGAGLAAFVIGPLVLEFLLFTSRGLQFARTTQELIACLKQFKQAAGNDNLRENLVRHAGWLMVEMGCKWLLALAAAAVFLVAVPLLLAWSEKLWTIYFLELSGICILWWTLRKKFVVKSRDQKSI
jgi:hypothetical protein